MFARLVVTVLITLAAVVAALCLGGRPLARRVDQWANSTTPAPSTGVSQRALALHTRLRVVDMHCDALAWDRDLLTRSSRGHVDIPRLREGGVDLQVFSVVTRNPAASNYRRTPNVADAMTLLALAQHWPRNTWFDPFARARYQSSRLRSAAAASGGRLVPVTRGADLDALASSPSNRQSVGAVLLLEGLHALEHDLSRVDSLFADGFRIFGVAHMFDNDVGGSAHGWRRHGLTPFGRRVIARIDSLGGIIDLAHASPTTIDDVLALTTRPAVVSHTGAQAACPGPRNLTDDQIARVATRGGLIAVGFWDAAVCGEDAASIARTIRHCVRVAGIEQVALGSDFDGGVRTPFDAAGLSRLTDALVQEGFSERDIALVMGENAWRFLRRSLPSR